MSSRFIHVVTCVRISFLRLVNILAGYWWLMPVILATQEAEIRRIAVQSQPRQTVYQTLSQKYLRSIWVFLEWSGSRCRP
jgi:hypothetical protein